MNGRCEKSEDLSAECLEKLPALFHGSELTHRFGWTSTTAADRLELWVMHDLVAHLGGRSDFHANLIVDGSPNWEAALRLAMPTALIVGIEALRRAHWTTQIPQRFEVAVDAAHPVFELDRYEILPRAASWFACIAPAITHMEDSLSLLSPAWALADLLSRGEWGSFSIDPDDIDWDAVNKSDEVDWSVACAALGLPRKTLTDMVEHSR